MGGGAVLANGNSGLSPTLANSRLQLSPRYEGHQNSAARLDTSGKHSSSSLKPPLYTRGHSKIGSGVIRPRQPNAGGNASAQQAAPFQQHNTGLQHLIPSQGNSRRLRQGPAGSFSNLINSNPGHQQNPHLSPNQQYFNISPQQSRILEEAKRASSVVSTGDSTNSNRSGGLHLNRNPVHRRVGSGQDRHSRIGTGLVGQKPNTNYTKSPPNPTLPYNANPRQPPGAQRNNVAASQLKPSHVGMPS